MFFCSRFRFKFTKKKFNMLIIKNFLYYTILLVFIILTRYGFILSLQINKVFLSYSVVTKTLYFIVTKLHLYILLKKKYSKVLFNYIKTKIFTGQKKKKCINFKKNLFTHKNKFELNEKC